MKTYQFLSKKLSKLKINFSNLPLAIQTSLTLTKMSPHLPKSIQSYANILKPILNIPNFSLTFLDLIKKNHLAKAIYSYQIETCPIESNPNKT